MAEFVHDRVRVFSRWRTSTVRTRLSPPPLTSSNCRKYGRRRGIELTPREIRWACPGVDTRSARPRRHKGSGLPNRLGQSLRRRARAIPSTPLGIVEMRCRAMREMVLHAADPLLVQRRLLTKFVSPVSLDEQILVKWIGAPGREQARLPSFMPSTSAPSSRPSWSVSRGLKTVVQCGCARASDRTCRVHVPGHTLIRLCRSHGRCRSYKGWSAPLRFPTVPTTIFEIPDLPSILEARPTPPSSSKPFR